MEMVLLFLIHNFTNVMLVAIPKARKVFGCKAYLE